MKLIRTRVRAWAAVLCLIVILTDRITKMCVLKSDFLSDGSTISVLRNVVSFFFVWNTGAAFSFLNAHPVWITVISALILVVLAFFVFLPKRMDAPTRISLSLVLSGGIGNLVDRFLYGAVVDFIRLDFIRFPIFNAADMAVTMGFALFFVTTFLPNGKKGNA